MKTKALSNQYALTTGLLMVGVLVLSACAPATPPPPTQDVGLIQTQAAQTVVAEATKNAPPTATQAPPPTAAPTQAPPPGPTTNPSIPLAVVPIPVTGEPAAVARFNTKIYSGPGTNYVVYASFLGGATAKVVGKSQDGKWWAISVPVAPGGSGWVDASWVMVSNAGSVPVLPTPPVPPTAELVSPGQNDPQATTLANVYVRSGPGGNFPAYGIAPAGLTARVIGKSEDGQWWVVRLNPQRVGAGYGWVMAQYTQASNTSGVQTIQTPIPPASIPSTAPASGVPVAVAVDYVNVRTGPGTNYPVLGFVGPGASSEVTGKSADGVWWQVKVPTRFAASGSGWVAAGFVITQNTESVPVAAAPSPQPTVAATPLPSGGSGCQLVSQNPLDGTVFAPGTAFSTTWVLKNTTSYKWDQAEVDARYLGAAGNIPLHEGEDVYDFTASVQPGDTYNLTVAMIAPFDPGTYGELWELALGSLPGKPTCQFHVYIQVK